MNRRDVIIIAVLVNAGLLVVLFASALKSGNDQPEISVQKESVVNTSSMAKNDVPPPRGDEVDQVLSQFATVNSSQTNTSPAMATPVLQTFPQSSPTPSGSASSFSDAQSPLPSFSNEIPNFNPQQTLSASSSLAPVPAFSEPAPEEKPVSGFKEVKVKKGDALEKIARTHHTTVQELMRVNKLSSTQLKIGQVLKIPTKNAKGKASSATAVASNSGETKHYTVKNGDNPWTIAVKNHMKVDELLKLNGLDEEKARKLKPGDQLRIR